MRLLLLVLLTGLSCRANAPGPYAPRSEADRDTQRAQELSRSGADQIDSNPAGAEATLRQALSEDIFYGPAHNNLGVLYLEQGKLFEAASEFEWARKLMPGHPDPRMNLALTLEQAGKYDEAIQSYEAALQAYPNHIPSEQALARLLISLGRDDESLRDLLQRIALGGESEHWRRWAQKEALRQNP